MCSLTLRSHVLKLRTCLGVVVKLLGFHCGNVLALMVKFQLHVLLLLLKIQILYGMGGLSMVSHM